MPSFLLNKKYFPYFILNIFSFQNKDSLPLQLFFTRDIVLNNNFLIFLKKIEYIVEKNIRVNYRGMQIEKSLEFSQL